MNKFLLAIGLLAPSLLWGNSLKNDLSFYSSFNGNLEPDVAKGSKVVHAGKVKFSPGVRGKAADINKAIKYMAAANADINKGTVAFWHKPAWNPTEKIGFRTPFDLVHIRLNYIPKNKAMFFMTGKSFPEKGFRWTYGCQTKEPAKWQPGSWQHVAISWNKETGRKKIYLNGKVAADSTTKVFPDSLSSNAAITLGKNAPGLYDELFIWQRELAPDEVALLYKQPAKAADSILSKATPKEENTQTDSSLFSSDNIRFYVAFDKSVVPTKVLGSNSVKTGKDISYDSGIVNNSVKLDGTKINYNSTGNINITSGTISFWIKPEKALKDLSKNIILFRSGHLALSYQPSRKTLFFMTGKHNGEYFRWDYSPATKILENWKAGEWHNITVCWDASTGRKELYIDGKSTGTSVSSRMPTRIMPKGELFIGENFKGNIDELVYFNNPLPPGTIAAICADPTLIPKAVGIEVDSSVKNLPFQKTARTMLQKAANLSPVKFDVPMVKLKNTIIEPGKTFSIAIPVRNPSLNSYSGKVTLTLRNFWMKDCGQKVVDLNLKSGESKKLNISFSPELQGIYKIEAIYNVKGEKKLRDLSSFACFPLPVQPDPDSFFGNHINGWTDGKYLEQAARLGQNWQRDHNMVQVTWWNRVQPDPGKFTWTYDFQLKYLKKYNMPLLGQLFTTPYWAAAKPQAKPKPGYNKCWAPNLKYFEKYVFETVSKYKDYIKYWEIWNEPAVGIFWKGNTKEFGQMVQTAVRAAKKADPNCVVMSAGYTCSAWAWHNEAAKHGALKGLDMISIHYGCPKIPALESYQKLGAIIDHFQQLAVKYGPGKKLPIWSTEAGCGDSTFLRGLDYPQLPPESERKPLNWYKGAVKVVQGEAVLMSHNVGKHFIYLQNRVSPSASNALFNTSMLDINHTPRPKLIARAVMQSQLDWTRFHSRVFRKTGRFWANIHESNKQKSTVIVLWCGDEGEVELKCQWPGKVTSILNIMGNKISTNPQLLKITEEPFYIHVAADAATVSQALEKARLKVIKEPVKLELNDGPDKADVPVLADFVAPSENISSNFTVDIRKYCNMGFADDKAGDGKGGWSDEGPFNDLRDFKTGKRTFYGVTFDIINPAKNNGKSVITMRGNSVTPKMPEKVTIPINRKVRTLYFLHAASWGSPGDITEYVLNFADGTQQKAVINIPKHNNNWWNGYNPKEVSKPVPVKVSNTVTGKPQWRYLRVFEFAKDPLKDSVVKSVDIISIGRNQTPIILGISGTR